LTICIWYTVWSLKLKTVFKKRFIGLKLDHIFTQFSSNSGCSWLCLNLQLIKPTIASIISNAAIDQLLFRKSLEKAGSLEICGLYSLTSGKDPARSTVSLVSWKLHVQWFSSQQRWRRYQMDWPWTLCLRVCTRHCIHKLKHSLHILYFWSRCPCIPYHIWGLTVKLPCWESACSFKLLMLKLPWVAQLII
jgi:hypothetical protein